MELNVFIHTSVEGVSQLSLINKPLEMIAHKPLSAAPQRLQRMFLDIQGYAYKIVYKPGKDIGLADALSRLPNPMNKEESPLDVRIEFIHFKNSKLEEIRENINRDPVLRELVEVITHGWPKKQNELATQLRSYWSYRDELSVENGVILKGSRIFIPEKLRKDILKDLHTGHLGIVKTLLRACRDVFWPKVNQDITDMCKSCQVCDELRNTQSKETLQPHEIPSQPWQVLGTDLFDLANEQYLIVADYFSKFIVVDKLPKLAPSSVIVEYTKNILCNYGIPRKIVSDNGPHYNSGVYKQFVDDWGIEHVTSSPTYAQSNGFIERQVQTVKKVIQKSTKADEDVYLALLRLKTNPVDTGIPSPAEIMFKRCIGDTIPSYSKSDQEELAEKLKIRQDKQKTNFDRRAKDLPPLVPGTKITVRNHRTGLWEPAIVERTTENPRSYIVTNEKTGQTVRRNRKRLRDTMPKTENIKPSRPESTIPVVIKMPSSDTHRKEIIKPPRSSESDTFHNETVQDKEQDGGSGNLSKMDHKTPIRTTRSGRIVKENPRYK